MRLGHHTRITRYDASSSDSGRAIHDRTLKALPIAAGGASRHARGFTPLALSVGYLTKEILSLRLGMVELSFAHGTGRDADDRQGNRACSGDGAGLPTVCRGQFRSALSLFCYYLDLILRQPI